MTLYLSWWQIHTRRTRQQTLPERWLGRTCSCLWRCCQSSHVPTQTMWRSAFFFYVFSHLKYSHLQLWSVRSPKRRMQKGKPSRSRRTDTEVWFVMVVWEQLLLDSGRFGAPRTGRGAAPLHNAEVFEHKTTHRTIQQVTKVFTPFGYCPGIYSQYFVDWSGIHPWVWCIQSLEPLSTLHDQTAPAPGVQGQCPAGNTLFGFKNDSWQI